MLPHALLEDLPEGFAIEAEVRQHGTTIQHTHFSDDAFGAADVLGEPLIGLGREFFVDVEAVEGPFDAGLLIVGVAGFNANKVAAGGWLEALAKKTCERLER